MARYGKKEATPARKRLWKESATRWTRVGQEEMWNDVFIRREGRKPPQYKLEQSDINGVLIEAALIKAPKLERGWHLLLQGGAEKHFKTKRKALDFFSRLQHLDAKATTFDVPHVQTPEDTRAAPIKEEADGG